MQHLQPNTILQGGKYRIERVLRHGGFDNTYEGYDIIIDELVAIKEMYAKENTPLLKDKKNSCRPIKRN